MNLNFIFDVLMLLISNSDFRALWFHLSVCPQVHLRHEESPSHIKSALDVSYGKHWDEINNKRTLLLSQSFKNQSTANHTSYTLEVCPLRLTLLLSFY